MFIWIVVGGIICLVALGMLLNKWYCTKTIATEIIVVADKKGKPNKEGDEAKYKIYSKDGRVFKNTTNVWLWKFRNEELQERLQPGKRYRIQTWGMNIPWLGLRKHILTAIEIRVGKRVVMRRKRK